MPWLQLIVEADESEAERLSDLLSDAGAVSVTFQDDADQPLYEPPPGATPLWRRTRVVGLFPAEADPDRLSASLKAALAPEALPPHRFEVLEDRDWSREWMDAFEPMRFGQRLWIVPSWHRPPAEDAVNILLDPGLAFGTGTHPTTRLCLEWLDGRELAGATVVDYGCGSGILAIAAAMLGAREVFAVDNDPQALLATAENAGRNGVAERVNPLLPEQMPPVESDLLIANILATPLISLAPRFAMLVRGRGSIALSGILPEQAAQVARAYSDWFRMDEPVEHDGWVRLQGQRHG